MGLGMMALMAAAVGSGVEAQDRSFEWQGEMRAGQVLEVRDLDRGDEFKGARLAPYTTILPKPLMPVWED